MSDTGNSTAKNARLAIEAAERALCDRILTDDEYIAKYCPHLFALAEKQESEPVSNPYQFALLCGVGIE